MVRAPAGCAPERPAGAALLAALSLALGACAVRAAPPARTSPAHAEAPAGRLAGPPPSLRAGVVSYPEVPPVRPADEPAAGHGHHHHGHHAP